MTVPLLEIAGLTAAYGQVRALHGVDLTVGEGEVVALLGPNGAGKTTTLRAVCGMVRTAGRVAFRGRDLTGLATEKIA
ncbi:MAG TPA: ATP-binding cassette domain-containing protein, partial [Mycobacteriales bacterium]